MQKYHRYITGDAAIDRNLQDVQRCTDSIINEPILNGVVLNLTLTTSYAAYPHGLGQTTVNVLQLAGITNGVVMHDASKDILNVVYLKASTAGTYPVLVF